MRPGLVYDSNATVLADAVRELGGEPVPLGIVPDDRAAAATRPAAGAGDCDVVLLSRRHVEGRAATCPTASSASSARRASSRTASRSSRASRCAWRRSSAASATVPVVILPGFPTSAIFTFHEFVAPVLRRLAAARRRPTPRVVPRPAAAARQLRARPDRVPARRPRRQCRRRPEAWVGVPDGQGLRLGDHLQPGRRLRHHPAAARVPRGRRRRRRPPARPRLQPADLVVIGSHCVGLDYLLGQLQDRGLREQVPGGRQHRRAGGGPPRRVRPGRRPPARPGDRHLQPPVPRPRAGTAPRLRPAAGGRVPARRRALRRAQRGRSRRAPRWPTRTVSWSTATAAAARDLIDRLLGGARPPGYSTRGPVAQRRRGGRRPGPGRLGRGHRRRSPAAAGLGFLPLREEQYDFVVPEPA